MSIKRLKLTGAAILVFRCSTSLQAARQLSRAFSPSGQLLASGSLDKTIKLWDVQTTRARATFQGHAGHVWAVAFSPDGKTLASVIFDKTIRLWDATGAK